MKPAGLAARALALDARFSMRPRARATGEGIAAGRGAGRSVGRRRVEPMCCFSSQLLKWVKPGKMTDDKNTTYNPTHKTC
eukprot:8089430-Heterocapsa_arctica.AAC.1